MWLQIAKKCCIKTNTSIAGCYLRTINLSASSSRVLLTAPPYRGSSQRPAPLTIITRVTQYWYRMPYLPAWAPLSGLFNPEQPGPGNRGTEPYSNLIISSPCLFFPCTLLQVAAAVNSQVPSTSTANSNLPAHFKPQRRLFNKEFHTITISMPSMVQALFQV